MRHPFYVSYVLGWIGGALGGGRSWAWLPVAGMGSLYVAAARREERQFRRGRLGQEYREYQRRTGMFLPRLRSIAFAGAWRGRP
jgi:protein-S-isoprenylcysteine O-methyltransferase Ste14